MHVDTNGDHVGQLGDAVIDLASAHEGNAELVLGLAGRNLGMSAGIDVRIDAHGHAGGEAHILSDHGQALELGLAFDVEALDADFEAPAHFGNGLGDA
ncbi:hypothetical protein D9M68_868720 [compost metagenome]